MRNLLIPLFLFLGSPVFAADVIVTSIPGRQTYPAKLKDMGDGSWAEVIYIGGTLTNPAVNTPTTGTPATTSFPNSGGVQMQIVGLNADSLLVQQSLDCTNYVTATVLKQDLTTVAATALTGTSANGIYSVMVFGGCLKITRTGSVDTLTITYRGTN